MTENQNGSFRPKRINFAQISNTALWDDNLSLKAKGLYSLIQSLITIPGMDLRIWKIKAKCKEKDKAFESSWAELKKNGYLKQYRIPSGAKGAFKYEYDLLFEPDLKTPAVINLDKFGNIIPHKYSDENSQAESFNDTSEADSDHTPQNGGSGEKPENQSDHTPHFPPSGKSTPCLEHPMENGGGNSNTPSSNTLSSNTKSGNNQSISLSDDDTDRQTDEIRKDVLSRIDLDWIADNHPCDLDAAKTLIDCIVEMLVNPFTKINKTDQSRYALNKRLENVSENEIIGFLEHMRGTKVKYIKNINAYWKSAFINYLRESTFAASTF